MLVKVDEVTSEDRLVVQRRVQVLLAVFRSSREPRTLCTNQERMFLGISFVHDKTKEWLPVSVTRKPGQSIISA